MLCKFYWIVSYTVHFTAFSLGGPFFSGHGVDENKCVCVFVDRLTTTKNVVLSCWQKRARTVKTRWRVRYRVAALKTCGIGTVGQRRVPAVFPVVTVSGCRVLIKQLPTLSIHTCACHSLIRLSRQLRHRTKCIIRHRDPVCQWHRWIQYVKVTT